MKIMNKFYIGQLVKCIESFNGISEDGTCIHHNPPMKGEIFTILGIDFICGQEYLILGEVTNTQKYRGAFDVFISYKFKSLEEKKTEKSDLEVKEPSKQLN